VMGWPSFLTRPSSARWRSVPGSVDSGRACSPRSSPSSPSSFTSCPRSIRWLWRATRFRASYCFSRRVPRRIPERRTETPGNAERGPRRHLPFRGAGPAMSSAGSRLHDRRDCSRSGRGLFPPSLTTPCPESRMTAIQMKVGWCDLFCALAVATTSARRYPGLFTRAVSRRPGYRAGVRNFGGV
jgi:hypothetical protein